MLSTDVREKIPLLFLSRYLFLEGILFFSLGQIVAIKQLSHDGVQGSKEFLVEVLMLIMLWHRNLVSLIGFCMDGDERLLVYEYMSKGSLENHLFRKFPCPFKVQTKYP